MANIRTVLKNAKTVLFSDSEYFHKDVTGIKNISDLKSWFSIVGNVYKTGEYGNNHEFKLAGSEYRFSLTIIY